MYLYHKIHIPVEQWLQWWHCLLKMLYIFAVHFTASVLKEQHHFKSTRLKRWRIRKMQKIKINSFDSHFFQLLSYLFSYLFIYSFCPRLWAFFYNIISSEEIYINFFFSLFFPCIYIVCNDNNNNNGTTYCHFMWKHFSE